MKRTIFCFGSNLAGRHGAGAALDAKNKWGARLGRGDGLYGDSYAIPTKDADLEVLPIHVIKNYVETFLLFARRMPELEFCVTKIGCGLAGYSEGEMLDLFDEVPDNVILPAGWEPKIATYPWMTMVGPYTNLTKGGFYRVLELHPADRAETGEHMGALLSVGWSVCYDGPAEGVDGARPVILLAKEITPKVA